MKLREFVEKMGPGRSFKCYRNSEKLKILVPKVDERPALVVSE